MPSTYKTPGVYVEEISLFPPSVAQVETAVPAFIGYTEKAIKNGESLTKKPTKVYSLTEYESYFGKGPDSTYNVYLDNSDNVSKVTSSQTYYLYESIRLFFENGGGKCYIISVAPYDTATGNVDINLLTGALAPLEKEDEPTLIICPDAVRTSTSLYDFQQKALLQCGKLGDRFLVCDLLKSDETVANETLQDRINEFRDKIGINNLKYGAAYAPYVFSSLPRTIKYRNLSLFRGDPPGTALSIEALTSDNNITQLIYDLQNSRKGVDDLKAYISTVAPGILTGTSKAFEDEYKKLFDAYAVAATDVLKLAAVKNIYVFTLKVLAAVKTVKDALPTKVAVTPDPASKTSSKSFSLKSDVDGIVSSTSIKTVLETLVKHSNAANADDVAGELFTDDPTDVTKDLNKALLLTGLVPASYATTTDPAITALYANPVTDAQKNEEARKAIAAAYSSVVSFFYSVLNAAMNYEKTLDDSLAATFGLYKTILNKVALATSELPPSGAVAGVYAFVDNARGVWKAPANVSLSSVIGPVTPLDNAFQDDMNVDVNAGKSVNAIRAFTGKGTLIWGARTLAGNDNEWRYVSVRRFYNMVEESVKKASGQFVFEPNDANTWTKIKGMIENYLTNLWRQGALAGAKAEHAFFVKVGLGVTMTAIDILEGKMNVEIGMAVVRPAEFIILKFSHKMQES